MSMRTWFGFDSWSATTLKYGKPCLVCLPTIRAKASALTIMLFIPFLKSELKETQMSGISP